MIGDEVKLAPSCYYPTSAKKGMKYEKKLNTSVVSLMPTANNVISYFSLYLPVSSLLLLATKIAAAKNAAAASNAPMTGVRLSG